MKITLLTFFIIFQLDGFAQADTSQYNFDYKVMEVEGDLNNDRLVDMVVITQDTLDENAPYKLQVFFKESNGNLKFIVSSTRIIEPQYPDGRDGYRTGNGFSDVTIKNGVLSVNFELLRDTLSINLDFKTETLNW